MVATAMVVLTACVIQTSAAGGEGILDSQQWLRPIPKAGPDEEGKKGKMLKAS